MGLQDAMEVVEAIHANIGHGNCAIDQIAAWVHQSAKSSGLRIQLNSARQFGLIENESLESFHLTPLGRKIVDPNQARKAKVEAFLNIPLYRAVFEQYKGSILPPTPALERDIARLGVSDKQKDRARLALEKSAEYAGFFEHGKNRLVEPAIKEGHTSKEKPKEEKPSGGNGGGGTLDRSDGDNATDPVIQGLVNRLPPADTDFPFANRVKWLQTMANAFGIIYTDDNQAGEIVVSFKEIPLA